MTMHMYITNSLIVVWQKAYSRYPAKTLWYLSLTWMWVKNISKQKKCAHPAVSERAAQALPAGPSTTTVTVSFFSMRGTFWKKPRTWAILLKKCILDAFVSFISQNSGYFSRDVSDSLVRCLLGFGMLWPLRLLSRFGFVGFLARWFLDISVLFGVLCLSTLACQIPLLFVFTMCCASSASCLAMTYLCLGPLAPWLPGILCFLEAWGQADSIIDS